jgi:orotate phosphoribosyltransferase
MDKVKQQFLKFMQDCGALLFGDFTLKSGRQSPYFVNTGEYKTNRQMERLCEFYGVMIEESMDEDGIDFDVLYGPAYKGIPLAYLAASNLEKEVGIAFNRKEAKDHGDGKSILGYVPKNGDRVAIIEDVTTAGTSIRETIDLFKEMGVDVKIVALYISIDREEKGTGDVGAVQQIRKEFGIPVYSIATASDIVEYLEKKGESLKASKMRAYLKEYGV